MLQEYRTMTSTFNNVSIISEEENKRQLLIDFPFLCKEIVTNIIKFLPAQQQLRSCKLVSTTWREAADTLPLRNMRIEDTNKNQCSFHDIPEGDDTTVYCRLFNISSIPMSVRGQITKLIVVLRLVNKNMDRYDIDSISNLLEGFSMLEDLTIISKEANLRSARMPLDFIHGTTNVFIIKYILLQKNFPSLRKFAPNLEYISIEIRCYLPKKNRRLKGKGGIFNNQLWKKLSRRIKR